MGEIVSNSLFDGNYTSCLNDGICSDPAHIIEINCTTYGTCSIPLWNNDEAGCLGSGTCAPDGTYNNDEVGCLVAGIILGVAESLGAYFVDPGLTLAINYALFIVILLIRPKGLFGVN